LDLWCPTHANGGTVSSFRVGPCSSVVARFLPASSRQSFPPSAPRTQAWLSLVQTLTHCDVRWLRWRRTGSILSDGQDGTRRSRLPSLRLVISPCYPPAASPASPSSWMGRPGSCATIWRSISSYG